MRNTISLNYVLTQTVGKLKPKDLKEAIKQQREFRAKQKEYQENARARTSGGSSAGEGDASPANSGKYSVDAVLAAEVNEKDTRQIKEMAFLQDIQDLDREEKEREFKSSVTFTGEALMSKRHVDMINSARSANASTTSLSGRQAERMRSSDMFCSPYEIPSKYGRASTQVGSAEFLHQAYQPTFDVYKNDLWRKRRKQVSERSERAIWKTLSDEVREMATDIMAYIHTKLTHPIRLAGSLVSLVFH